MAETMLLLIIRQKVNKRLKELGATTEETAKSIDEINLPRKWLEIPGVKKTKDNRYYLSKKQ